MSPVSYSFEFIVPNHPLFDERGPAIVNEELGKAVNGATLVFKGTIQPLSPINTGILRQGVQTSITGSGTEIVGKVFDPVAYAMPVEMGSRPHFPPIAPLQLWVRRKLGITDERESRSVAFLIARAISKRGTKAAEFFKRGIDAGRGQAETLFSKANERIASRLVGRG